MNEPAGGARRGFDLSLSTDSSSGNTPGTPPAATVPVLVSVRPKAPGVQPAEESSTGGDGSPAWQVPVVARAVRVPCDPATTTLARLHEAVCAATGRSAAATALEHVPEEALALTVAQWQQCVPLRLVTRTRPLPHVVWVHCGSTRKDEGEGEDQVVSVRFERETTLGEVLRVVCARVGVPAASHALVFAAPTRAAAVPCCASTTLGALVVHDVLPALRLVPAADAPKEDEEEPLRTRLARLLHAAPPAWESLCDAALAFPRFTTPLDLVDALTSLFVLATLPDLLHLFLTLL